VDSKSIYNLAQAGITGNFTCNYQYLLLLLLMCISEIHKIAH